MKTKKYSLFDVLNIIMNISIVLIFILKFETANDIQFAYFEILAYGILQVFLIVKSILYMKLGLYIQANVSTVLVIIIQTIILLIGVVTSGLSYKGTSDGITMYLILHFIMWIVSLILLIASIKQCGGHKSSSKYGGGHKLSKNQTIKVVLSYFIAPIAPLIVLYCISGNSKNTNIHASQAIVLWIIETIIVCGLNFIGLISTVNLVSWIFLIITIYAISKAIIKEQEPEIQYIYPIAKKIFSKKID